MNFGVGFVLRFRIEAFPFGRHRALLELGCKVSIGLEEMVPLLLLSHSDEALDFAYGLQLGVFVFLVFAELQKFRSARISFLEFDFEILYSGILLSLFVSGSLGTRDEVTV